MTQQLRTISSVAIDAGAPTFTSACHGLTAGTKVVITVNDKEPSKVPCGLDLNTIYYVIAAGLTTDEFTLSATSGGSSIIVSGTAAGTFFVAVPVDITGYVIDADIKDLATLAQVATFTATLPNASEGEYELSLMPAASVALSAKDYGYDICLAGSPEERYYVVTGIASVDITYTRS